jgi:uncharacterized membrane protein
MSDYEQSGSVHAPAQELFDFLAEVRNLPRYFERMTSAEPADGDAVQVEAVVPGGRHEAGKAWFKANPDTRTITWGSERDKDYSGEVEVDGDDTESTVTIRIHLSIEGKDTEATLAESIDNIRRLVEHGDAPSS